MQLQCRPKNFKIIPISGRERATDPTKVTHMNIVSQLIVQTTIFELEQEESIETCPLICGLSVHPIHLKQTVIPNVILLSILKDDLNDNSQ